MMNDILYFHFFGALEYVLVDFKDGIYSRRVDYVVGLRASSLSLSLTVAQSKHVKPPHSLQAQSKQQKKAICQ
jgi:hypothetical protein